MAGRLRPRAAVTELTPNDKLSQSSYHYKQSSQLPNWLQGTLSAIFQVKRDRNDKTIPGKLILYATILLSIGHLGLDMWYTVLDIKSENTKQTVTSGFFITLIAILWSTMSVYANRLCRKLLSSNTFVDTLRLHSKTVFKIPASVLMAVMAVTVIGINSYTAYQKFWISDTCKNVSLDILVCQTLFIIRIVHSTLVLLFNLCIAAAVFSVCRTHTIGVRRFIRALEQDGIACEAKHRQKFLKMKFAASNNLAELYLPEQCYGDCDELDDDDDDVNDDDCNNDQQRLVTYRQSDLIEVGSAAGHVSDTNSATQSGSNAVGLTDLRKPRFFQEYNILSKDDILFSYWKLSSRMRKSSKTLQRWISAWIVFTILWLLKWILTWVDHSASYFEIAQFLFPLLMVIILCTGYSEANNECEKVIWSITPLQDRLELIRSLPHIKIGMTLYNHPIAYANIATFVAGLLLALSSRIILDDFLPPSTHS